MDGASADLTAPGGPPSPTTGRPTAAATKLHAEGAEFLVLGQLLIRGVGAHKAYSGFTGYDVIAHNAAGDQTARIQVKARTFADADNGFPIKEPDGADFVVLVRLNRQRNSVAVEPEFFVLPMAEVAAVYRPKLATGGWPKARFSRTQIEQWRDRWDLIIDHLDA